MEFIRKVWVKGKWYLLGIIAALVIVLGIVFQHGKGSPTEKLLKSVFEGQKKIVQSEVSRKKEKEAVVDQKIEKVDEKLKALEKRKEEESKAVDKMDLKELADAWKELGL